MKPYFPIVIVLLLVSTSFVGVSYTFEQSSVISSGGITLYVGGSGPGNYSKIQYAIDNASDGDTVFVFDNSSPYNETVFVNESINLIGENKDTTVICGTCYIFAEQVTISNFKIQYKFTQGIIIRGNYSTINNNNISSKTGHDGINIESFNNNVIANNTIYYNDFGIFLRNSNNNTIIGNSIRSEIEDGIYSATFGIYLHPSSSNTIFGNNVSNHDLGICIYDGSNNNTIMDNIISNNVYGICSSNSSKNNITKNTVSYSSYGIDFHFSKSNTITGNKIIKNIEGIGLTNCRNNTIADNKISKNRWGIFSDSAYTNISSNIISINIHGIFLFVYNYYNIITGNTVRYNLCGINIFYNSDKIIITGNNIQNNIVGVRLGSRNSIIEKNNFKWNIIQAHHKSSLRNTWDSNYWSNWIGLKIPMFQDYPNIIFGRWGIIGFIPWLNFDWNPAQEPYDIEV